MYDINFNTKSFTHVHGIRCTCGRSCNERIKERESIRKYACLLHYRQLYMRWILRGSIDLLRCFLKIRLLRFENVRHILLRISIDYREPAALNLTHDLVAFFKHMI